jgi:hypothetical protein
MPGTRQDGIFSFRTIDSKELRRQMVLVCSTYRNNNVPQFDVEFRTDRFLDPELFESNFSATFYFTFIFSGFLFLYFNGTFRSA